MASILALVVALLSGGRAVAGEQARSPEPPPFFVVQADGSTLRLVAPPVEKGALLVGTLAGSGRLVSIPKRDVDLRRTTEMNRRPPPPAPTPEPAVRVLATGGSSLAKAGRLRTSPEEARRLLEAPSREPTAPAAPGVAAPSPRPTPVRAGEEGADDPRDASGRSEAWWHAHAGARRRELEEAEARLAVARADLTAAERADLLPGEAQQRSFVVRVQVARERVERETAAHAEAERRWRELEEDARKSGTPPGWLR